jgi:thiopeptide-type bacteriocin biosynthesis protein
MITAKDFYLLRTPYLPLDFLRQFEGVSLSRLSEHLKVTFDDPALQEAIYIASPELFGEFMKWKQGNVTDEKNEQKLVLSLYRYLLRMSSRCTPYGLFAGCAVGRFDEHTRVALAGPANFRKHSRLDMNYVAELAALVADIPGIRRHLLYYPNTSLYKIADRYRYAEFSVKNKYRNYHLAEVTVTDYLEKIIEAASSGASLASLAKLIVNEDVSETEASEFVAELVQSQVLVSELEPAITGEEFFTTLVRRTGEIPGASGISDKLREIQLLLQDGSAGIQHYLDTNALVKELLPETESKDLIQTDLFISTQQNTIHAGFMNDLRNQLEKLLPLARMNSQADMQNFREAFTARYGDQEVPLAWALDTESGIGYAGFNAGQADHTPLVDDIFPEYAPEGAPVSNDKFYQFQLDKLRMCLNGSSSEIELTDADLAGLQTAGQVSLPDSMYLKGSLLAGNSEAIDAGDYRFDLSGFGGPSAATMLGRFCHGDAELYEKTAESLREEEQFNHDAIYAEVVHLPESRVGNILLRPQLRGYEIVYLGNGSVPAERQIPLADLMVRVQNNTVFLRSIKFNKRVIPRLSTAHNFVSGSLPVYKFLCDLQFQHLHNAISWHWNKLKDEPFLPRVRYGKIILSKATWTINKKDIPGLNSKNAPAELPGDFRTRFSLPRFVVIAEADNELLIDLENEPCLHILATSLQKKEKLVLKEFLNTPENCFVESARGKHTNEIIIPLTRVAAPESPLRSKMRLHNQHNLARNFMAGSEWLYVKIYCGTNSGERLLKEVIRPLVQELENDRIIDQWFFIRYADPDNHIRIRFHHATNACFWKEVLERLHVKLNEQPAGRMAYKVQVDTYEREIERYGANTMEASEAFFHFDSEAVTGIIDMLEGEDGEQFRWLLAMRGVDMLLDDFQYTLDAKAGLLKQLQQAFYKEFGGGKPLSDQLNGKYREHMQQIRSFLDENNDAENGIEEAVALFINRSINLRRVVRGLKRSLITEPYLSMDNLVSSYIHMFLNRIFISNQRKHELVIYHFLSKYYDSQKAIRKSAGSLERV